MIKMYRILLMAFFAVSLVGCDELVGSTINDEEMEDIFSTESENDSTATKEQLEVMGVEFMPGYKRFKMFVSIKEDLGPYALTDTNQVVIKATEYIGGVPNHSSSKPILKLVKNTVGEAITKNSMKALVLVDLDQPQTVVNNELKAVREIRTVFRQNLYVAFMYDQSVSETMQASDYVLDSRFVSTQNTRKLLYRSILTKKKEIEDRVGVWADAKKVSMVVFSNEQVYDDDDEPFDIDHFTLEEEMVKPDTVLNTSFFTVSSVYFSEAEDNGDSDDQASSVLKVMTKNCGGIYEKQFSWSELKESIMGMKSEEIIANEYDFENPDGKVYSGISHKMVIELFAKDDGHLIGTATTDILLGVAYNPVIVNGGNNFVVFLQGVAIGLFVILLIYLVFQLLIPYINYRLFLKKYVVRYLPGNMSVGNIAVPDTCYYCKGHFETGEEIVVKCEHVMHKDCWDENQYHCPEYGRHCDKGSHYYNHVNLFDPDNALYHKRWIIVSVLAALLAWGLYVFMILEFDQTTPTLVAKMVESKITEVGNYAVFNDSDSNLGYLPLFGMCLGGCLTLFLSLLTDRIHFIECFIGQLLDLRSECILIAITVIGKLTRKIILISFKILDDHSFGFFNSLLIDAFGINVTGIKERQHCSSLFSTSLNKISRTSRAFLIKITGDRHTNRKCALSQLIRINNIVFMAVTCLKTTGPTTRVFIQNSLNAVIVACLLEHVTVTRIFHHTKTDQISFFCSNNVHRKTTVDGDIIQMIQCLRVINKQSCLLKLSFRTLTITDIGIKLLHEIDLQRSNLSGRHNQ